MNMGWAYNSSAPKCFFVFDIEATVGNISKLSCMPLDLALLIGLSKLAEDCASKYLASMIKKTVADVFQHMGHGSVIFWPLRL